MSEGRDAGARLRFGVQRLHRADSPFFLRRPVPPMSRLPRHAFRRLLHTEPTRCAALIRLDSSPARPSTCSAIFRAASATDLRQGARPGSGRSY